MEKIPRSRASELKKRKKKTKREKIVLACSDRQAEPPLLVFSEGETGSTASPSSPALGLLLPAARTEEVELREVHDGHRRAGEGGGEPESRAPPRLVPPHRPPWGRQTHWRLGRRPKSRRRHLLLIRNFAAARGGARTCWRPSVAELERYDREGERREVAAPPLPLPQRKKSHREAVG
jgi:hypothetical protein